MTVLHGVREVQRLLYMVKDLSDGSEWHKRMLSTDQGCRDSHTLFREIQGLSFDRPTELQSMRVVGALMPVSNRQK